MEISFSTMVHLSKDAKRQKKMSEQEIKQNCEPKAFARLAGKLKSTFPLLSVCILADSLYACKNILKICGNK